MSKIMEDFLAPYSLGKTMEIHSYALEMVRYGLTVDEVLAGCSARIQKHLEETKEEGVEAAPVDSFLPPVCPECQAPLRILRVNVSKCTNIGGPWNTSLECSNHQCMFSELSEKTIKEWRENGL